MRVKLAATSAYAAKREIQRRWPDLEVKYYGSDQHGELVFLSVVRKRGDRSPVATMTRNRSLRAVTFEAEIEEVQQ